MDVSEKGSEYSVASACFSRIEDAECWEHPGEILIATEP